MVQRHDRHRGVKVSLCVDQRDRLDPCTRLRRGIDRGHRVACGPQVAASSPSPALISKIRAGGGGSDPRTKAMTSAVNICP